MITKMPTEELLAAWKALWIQHRDTLTPNRKSGMELLAYLQSRYLLTEMHDKDAAAALSHNVTQNAREAEKLPADTVPSPRTFFLENAGQGERFYRAENQDPEEVWGGAISRIFVGVDLASGFFMVEGSTLLWDELCAFQGLDEADLRNFVCVAQYLNAQKRME